MRLCRVGRAVQRSALGRDGVPLLERGFDRLHGMITRVAARRAVGMPVGLIDEFNEYVATLRHKVELRERRAVEAAKGRDKLLPFVAQLAQQRSFAAVVPVSASKGKHLQELLAEIKQHLPVAEPMFDPEDLTDRPVRFLAAELDDPGLPDPPSSFSV